MNLWFFNSNSFRASASPLPYVYSWSAIEPVAAELFLSKRIVYTFASHSGTFVASNSFLIPSKNFSLSPSTLYPLEQLTLNLHVLSFRPATLQSVLSPQLHSENAAYNVVSPDVSNRVLAGSFPSASIIRVPSTSLPDIRLVKYPRNTLFSFCGTSISVILSPKFVQDQPVPYF